MEYGASVGVLQPSSSFPSSSSNEGNEGWTGEELPLSSALPDPNDDTSTAFQGDSTAMMDEAPIEWRKYSSNVSLNDTAFSWQRHGRSSSGGSIAIRDEEEERGKETPQEQQEAMEHDDNVNITNEGEEEQQSRALDSNLHSNQQQIQVTEKEKEEEARLLGELERIKVIVRVRPLLEGERSRDARRVVTCGGKAEGQAFHTNVTIRSNPQRSVRCRYDSVYGPEAKQIDVYAKVEGSATWVLDGYNSTIMAYGQTGSGKTYSMFGPPGLPRGMIRRGKLPEKAGIIPRAISEIFMAIRRKEAKGHKITVYCSFVQIYNEQLFDMLRDGGRDNPLIIYEDNNHDVYVQGLSEFMVKTMEECLAFLKIGEDNRAIRETQMNQASSRSHSVFQLVIEQESTDGNGTNRLLRSKLNLVDLAGSEKWDLRQDIATQHVQELTNINLSLFTLGRCVAALTAKTTAAHVPYRDSKLTRLIQDSLGGNTRTHIIANLNPTWECMEESISTLKFADRAKQVMVYVRQSEKPVIDHVLMEKLQREVGLLRGMVFKLKEAQAVSNAAAASTPPPPGGYKHPNINMLKATERIKALQSQLEDERQQSGQLREEVVKLQEELAKSSKHQNITEGKSFQESLVSLEREREAATVQCQSLSSKLNEILELNHHFVSLLTRFFAFEIEEADLRQALTSLVPNLDEFIHEPPPAPHRPAPPLLSSAATKGSSDALPSLDKNGQQHPQHTTSRPTAAEKQDEINKEMELVLPRLHAGGVPTVAYRIRGKPTHEIKQFIPAGFSKEEEEKKVIEQLHRARKRMQRHIRLQEWLMKKEQKELEAVEREEEERRAAAQAKRETDLRFRERAKRQKKKLETYYASLRKNAEMEGSGSDVESPFATTTPSLAFTPAGGFPYQQQHDLEDDE